MVRQCEDEDTFTPIAFGDEVEDDEIVEVADWRPSAIAELAPDPITIGLLVLGGGLSLGAGFVHFGAGPTHPMTFKVVIVGIIIIAATLYLRPLFTTVRRYPIPALNRHPTVERSHTVERHGVVKCGKTDVRRDDGTTRPYTWIWIEEAADNDCGRTGSYRWYQYVNPTFTIDNTERLRGKSFEAATGLTYRYGQWNPDYHQSEVGPSDPGFRPDGLNLGENNRGKPYKHYPIPGTRTAGGTSHLTGILDAPDFCNRTVSGGERLSQVERDVRRLIPRDRRTTSSQSRPPAQDVSVRISIDIRSYLVCIREGQVHCVGYVAWSYTMDVALRFVWSRSDSIELGAIPTWNLGSEMASCAYRLTIGDWTMPCERGSA